MSEYTPGLLEQALRAALKEMTTARMRLEANQGRSPAVIDLMVAIRKARAVLAEQPEKVS